MCSPNQYVEALSHNGMVFGGGASRVFRLGWGPKGGAPWWA